MWKPFQVTYTMQTVRIDINNTKKHVFFLNNGKGWTQASRLIGNTHHARETVLELATLDEYLSKFH